MPGFFAALRMTGSKQFFRTLLEQRVEKAQNANLKAKRNCRSSFFALVIWRKLAELVLRFPVLGLLKCGVLKKLNASARNCNSSPSVSLKCRNKPKSRFTTPGPRRRFRPEVPYRTPVTAANAVGS